MSPNKLHLECSLDKELYYHGETISVNVHIQNNSNKAVKKIKVSVRQFADICLFSTAQYKCCVDEKESEEGFPLGSGSTLSKVYELKPLLSNNKDKWGLALDGQLKHEDTNLASSTLIPDQTTKENLGIIVQYKVKVKLYLGPLAGELSAELPFTLMHPKPEPDPDSQLVIHPTTTAKTTDNNSSSPKPGEGDGDNPGATEAGDVPVDTNLIELDTDDNATNVYAENDDDLIFEDFARLRLKGETEA